MTDPIQIGAMFAHKYRVERILGRGGMGVVVAATHVQLHRLVAIKFLLPELMETPEIVARFMREARAAVSIESAHVARVIDVGEDECGVPFMVMEYLQGSDLSYVLAKRGPLPIQEAVDYVLQACEAIVEAHRLGIVHRDLKPANLFLAQQADGTSTVKVLDFGISKVASAHTDVALTSAATVMGSPLYMAPEQMRSTHTVDVRADIWALGVILYELLAGRVPFPGEGIHDVLAKVLTEVPTPLQELRPDLPPKLGGLILRCLEKDPAHRFASVADLAVPLAKYGVQGKTEQSLERILRVHQSAGYHGTEPGKTPEALLASSSPPSSAETNVGVARSTVAEDPTLEGAAQRRKRSPLLVVGLVALALLGAFALVGVWRTRLGASTVQDKGLGGVGPSVAIPSGPASSAAPVTSPVASTTQSAPAAVADSTAPEAGAPRPPVGSKTKGGADKAVPSAATAATATAPPTVTATATATVAPPPTSDNPPGKKSPLKVDIK